MDPTLTAAVSVTLGSMFLYWVGVRKVEDKVQGAIIAERNRCLRLVDIECVRVPPDSETHRRFKRLAASMESDTSQGRIF